MCSEEDCGVVFGFNLAYGFIRRHHCRFGRFFNSRLNDTLMTLETVALQVMWWRVLSGTFIAGSSSGYGRQL